MIILSKKYLTICLFFCIINTLFYNKLMKTKLKLHLLLPLCFTFASVYGTNNIQQNNPEGNEIEFTRLGDAPTYSFEEDVNSPSLETFSQNYGEINDRGLAYILQNANKKCQSLIKLDNNGQKLFLKSKKNFGISIMHFKKIFSSLKDAVCDTLRSSLIGFDILKATVDFLYKGIICIDNKLNYFKDSTFQTAENTENSITTDQKENKYLAILNPINRTVFDVGQCIKSTFLTVTNLTSSLFYYITSKIMLFFTRSYYGIVPNDSSLSSETYTSNNEQNSPFFDKVKTTTSSIWAKMRDVTISTWNNLFTNTQTTASQYTTVNDHVTDSDMSGMPSFDSFMKKQKMSEDNSFSSFLQF